MAEDMEMFLEEIIKKTNPEEYIKILEQDRQDFAEEINRLNNIIDEAIKYNKEIRDLYSAYETSQERSNAETNLCILEDKETLELFNELKEK